MKKLTSYTALVFGVLFLSTSAIFVKLAKAPSSITAFYRLFFALLILVPFVFFSKERRREVIELPKKQWFMSVMAGVMLSVHYILWFESLNYTSVASSTVLVTLQPIFTILLSFFILRERQTKIGMFGCFIALAGSFIIGYGDFQVGTNAILGDIMALAGAAFISLYFFIGQKVRQNTSATVYSALSYGSSVVFLAVYALLKGDPFFSYPLLTWKAFLGLAFVSTILGQFIFNLLLRWLPATAVSMSILGEPVGTCIMAYFILGETIRLQQGVGMLVILGGLGIYFCSDAINKKIKSRK